MVIRQKKRNSHQIVLMIGGNRGDRLQLINDAKMLLSEAGKITTASSIFETAPWGAASEGSYLNQALVIETETPPEDFILLSQSIETMLGRIRTRSWGNRTMDIDLLYDGDRVYREKDLIIPHPRIAERRFVLVPLVEILPDFIHPVLNLSNRELLKRCRDESSVEIFRQ